MHIQIGCRVSGFVGPKKKSNRKTKFRGSVIASQAGGFWTVWWDDIDKCSNHKATTLKVESRAPPGMVLKKEKVKEMLDNFFVDDPANKTPNPETQLLPPATEVSPPSHQKPPPQQQSTTTDDMAASTASPDSGEADPGIECQTQDEIEPNMMEAKTMEAEDDDDSFLEDPEEHHFQKHLTYVSEKQALIGSIVTVKSKNCRPLA